MERNDAYCVASSEGKGDDDVFEQAGAGLFEKFKDACLHVFHVVTCERWELDHDGDDSSMGLPLSVMGIATRGEQIHGI